MASETRGGYSKHFGDDVLGCYRGEEENVDRGISTSRVLSFGMLRLILILLQRDEPQNVQAWEQKAAMYPGVDCTVCN